MHMTPAPQGGSEPVVEHADKLHRLLARMTSSAPWESIICAQ